MSDALARKLHDGCTAMGLALPAEAEARLLVYLGLLVKWNAAYNLTAIRDPEQMVVKHLLDSLSLLPHVDGNSLVDVGSRRRLPGLVLAIVRPALAVTLLDSNGKKVRFLRQVIADLGISNAEAVQTRVEDFDRRFERISSRAFATLADMVAGSRQLLAPRGEFLAMKGQRPDAEIAALPADVVVRDVIALHVPGLDEERHLVRLALA